MEMNPKMQKEVVLYFFPGSCVEIKNHAVFGVRAPVCHYVLVYQSRFSPKKNYFSILQVYINT